VAKVEEAFDDLEGCLADLLAVCECHLETPIQKVISWSNPGLWRWSSDGGREVGTYTVMSSFCLKGFSSLKAYFWKRCRIISAVFLSSCRMSFRRPFRPRSFSSLMSRSKTAS